MMASKTEAYNPQRQWGTVPETDQQKPIIRALVASALGVIAILAASGGGAITSIIGFLILGLCGALMVGAWRDWEFGIKALLVIVIVEGAIRKWFMSSMLIYFYKDALLLVIIASYQSRHTKPPFIISQRLKTLYGIIASLVLYVMVEAVNPSLLHPFVGILGIKAYVFYIPLAFLTARMFTTKEKLISFLRWYALLALPVAFLGVMQFMDTNPNSSLNRYAWSEETADAVANATGMTSGIATFQDSAGSTYVRITSTFSYISGLNVYLPVTFALLLGLISLRSSSLLSGKSKWLYFISIGAIAITALMTGGRGVILMMAVSTLLFYGLTSSAKHLLRRIRQIAIGVAVVYVSAVMLFPQALDAFYTRAFGDEYQIEEGQGRLTKLLDLPFVEASYAGLMGYGAGATQNGIPALMNSLNLKPTGEEVPINYEDESGRVVLDLGVAGYILYGVMRYTLLLTLIGVCFSISDPDSKILAIASLSVLVFLLIVGGSVVSHTHNVYQWFLIGIPLALLNAERLERNRQHSFRRVGNLAA